MARTRCTAPFFVIGYRALPLGSGKVTHGMCRISIRPRILFFKRRFFTGFFMDSFGGGTL